MNLTQKETTLLNDLISQEKLCVEKYTKSSAAACDSQLGTLFSQIAQTENQHLNTLNQILGGTAPQMNSMQGGSGNSSGAQSDFSQNYTSLESGGSKDNDKFLCEDALSMEKHVSATYNTCVFEFKDTNVRNTLNHIQKEEQEHGEQIYNYMAQNGMYNA